MYERGKLCLFIYLHLSVRGRGKKNQKVRKRGGKVGKEAEEKDDTGRRGKDQENDEEGRGGK